MNQQLMKRTLSLLLALMLAVQMCPTFAFAAQTDDSEVDAISANSTESAEEEGEDPALPSDGSESDDESAQPAAEEDPAQEPEAEPAQEETEEETPLPAEESEEPSKAESEETSEEESVSEEEAPLTEEEAALTEEEITEEDLLERQIMDELDAELFALKTQPRRALAGSYESELAKFPASYQAALKALHEKHPSWIFVAVNTGLDWNKAVAGESGTASTMEYNEGPNSIASHLLLNNRDGYYKAGSYSGTNHYKPVDGRFVSASRACIAYYLDPRNFLTENYIFMFESEKYNDKTNVNGVTSILRTGCNTSAGMANIKTYVDRNGNTKNLSSLSSEFGSTYPEIIYNIGLLTDVSPYFIASKIVQETSANTNSTIISGKVSGYNGYYNFFNIGAYYTSDASAITNGMKYAKNHGWSNPILAIKGGIEFLADKYIRQGQDTAYYMRFNVGPKRTYSTYTHQYMSATAAAAGEGSSTFKGYKNAGALETPFLFYIPVYNNMPAQTSKVELTPGTNGKTTASETLYNAPAATASKLVTVPKGSSVTVLGGSVTSSESYINRLYYPYWYQVKVTVSGKSYTGYIHEQSVALNAVYNIKSGSTKDISKDTKITGSTGTIYYETSDPSVATVSATTGLIKAVGSGSCTIYAISGGGSFDAIGLKVSSSGSSVSDKETSGPKVSSSSSIAPTLKGIDNTASGVYLKWDAVDNAQSYNVYRKTGSSGWSLIDNVTTPHYTDTTAKYNTQYTYTVRAYVGDVLSKYDSTGLTIHYLETPTLFSVKATSKGNQVSWYQVSGAAGYYLYRKTDDSGWTIVATINSGKTVSYTDSTALLSQTKYTYTVRAFTGKTRSYYDREGISVVASVTTLSAPSLQSAVKGSTGITVTWKAVNGCQGYNVYRKTPSTGWKSLGKTKDVKWVDQSATENQEYIYTVSAYFGTTQSDYNQKGIKDSVSSIPALKSAKAGNTGITVTWDAVGGATGYSVYRKESGSGWLLVKKTSNPSFTDVNANLVKDTRYTYTVRASLPSGLSGYNAAGVSAASAKGTALAPPALKSIANVTSGVVFSWSAVNGAKSYNVYRKTSSTGWSKLATVTGTTKYTDKSVQNNKNYIYTVRAVSGRKISSYNTKGISVCYLSVPKPLSAAAGSNGITVKWQEVNGATGYQVYRKPSGGKWSLITTTKKTGSYTDNANLKKGTTYLYTVRALNANGRSYYNASGVSAKAVSNAAKTLEKYITTGMVNYRTGPGTNHGLAGTLNQGTTVQVVKDSGVTVGSSVWYQVKINNQYYYMSSKYLKAA